MSENNNGNNSGMGAFEMGTLLSRLDTKMDSITTQIAEVIQDFKEVHRDHEKRIRELKESSATKKDVNKAHERIDQLQIKIWRIVVYLAAGGTVTGGGITLFNILSG